MSKGKLGLLPLRDTLRPMSDLWTRLASAEGPRVLEALKDFLQNGCRLNPIIISANWPLWRKLAIGGKTADGLREELAHLSLNFSVAHMIGAMKLTPEPTKFEFVELTARELGLMGETITIGDLFTRVSEAGFELCPQDAAPQIRSVYTEQREREMLWVLSEPIPNSYGSVSIFGVHHIDRGRPDLYERPASPDDPWAVGTKFLVCQRRPLP